MDARCRNLIHPLNQWAMVGLVFGAAVVVYGPALQGQMLWDDPAHVTRLDLRSISGLWRIWTDLSETQQYYPVLYSVFWLEHVLWGDAVLGYHLVNVLWHALSCCLLAVLLRRLWTRNSDVVERRGIAGSRFNSFPAGAEWVAALFFAVHPICVESVAWISEQKNTLAFVFYLSAALVYLSFMERRGLGSYLAASVLCALALGTKTVTCTLPAALLVITWWKNGAVSWRRDVVPLLPWFAAAVSAGLLTAWVERYLVGAAGAEFALSFVERVLLASRIIWFYMAKLVWPVDLAFFYERWNVPAQALGWITYFGATLGLTAGLWWKRHAARGPLAVWLLFVGTSFPALGFFDVFPFVFSYVADHFQYLASAAFMAIAAAGTGVLFTHASSPLARGAVRGAAGLVFVILALLTYRQSGFYRNNEALFRETVTRTPESWMGHHILAVTLARAPGGQAEAIDHYETALRLNAAYPDAHLGLAIELAKLPGRKADAISHYKTAISLRPHYAEAHANLAAELALQPNRLAEAIHHANAALKVRPEMAEVHFTLGKALARGQPAAALSHFETAVRLRPDLAEAHARLAELLSSEPGRFAEAMSHGEEAIRLRPDFVEAQNSLAVIFARVGEVEKARALWESALRIKPDYKEAEANLRRLRELTNR